MRLHRASRSRTVDGTLLFQILRFSVPLALTGILQLVFNAMDNLVVGKFSGASALAAVGATTSLVHLIVGAFNGMSIGANIVVARAIGGEQDDQIKRTVNCAFALSGILGVAVMCLGVPLSSTMLAWMGTPEEILPLSARYLQIYFLGAPALVVFNFAAAVLRAYNDTTHPLLILSGCGVVNVALNLLFVIQLRMDVAGVALATTISQYLSLILILVFFLKANGTMKLRIRSVRLYPREAVDILAAGFPAGIQVIVFNTANVLIQSSVNIFGTHVIAANTASGSLCGFVYTAMNSVYHASVTFTSRAMGNRNYSAIPKLLNICLTAVFLIYLPLALVVSAFCPQLLGLPPAAGNIPLQKGTRLRDHHTAGCHPNALLCDPLFCLRLYGGAVRRHPGNGQSLASHDRQHNRLLPCPNPLDRHHLPGEQISHGFVSGISGKLDHHRGDAPGLLCCPLPPPDPQ